MAGDITIYRQSGTANASTTTYLTSTDKVDFNYTPQKSDGSYYAPDGGIGQYPAGTSLTRFPDGGPKPDERSFITSYDLDERRRQTDNPAAFQNDPRKPDTGYQGGIYTFNVVFDESTGRAQAIQLLKNWTEGFSDTEYFRKGRYGIRMRDRPEYNVVPDAGGGLKLIDFRITKNYQYRQVVEGVLMFELGGL